MTIRIGLIAEGTSDCIALEELISAVHPDVDFVRLRPDMTLVSKSPHGWRGVKAWCEQEGPRLEALLSGVSGFPIHILVIHVDCSMAHNVGASHPCPPARATADALREIIAGDWLGRDPVPDFIVLATPSLTTDTWVAAALDPPYSGAVPLECDDQVEREFVRRRLLRLRDGEVKKPADKYRPLAATMAREIQRVCNACSEANRFRNGFIAATHLIPAP